MIESVKPNENYPLDGVLINVYCVSLQQCFVNENHRVLSSYMNGVTSLNDSLSSATISDGLGEQMARVYGHLDTSVEDNGLTIHHVPVQKQEGGADCGLFAIAFGCHAAVGDHSDKMTFDQTKLHSYLVTCLEKEQLSKFSTPREKDMQA